MSLSDAWACNPPHGSLFRGGLLVPTLDVIVEREGAGGNAEDATREGCGQKHGDDDHGKLG